MYCTDTRLKKQSTISSAYNLMREMHVFGGETSPFKLHTEAHHLKFNIQLDAISH